ncbi:CAX-interacting protein 4 [Quercus suber]|uniref:Cax-interacting protein 4 n=1 Tax=Quercus suber TaxID=58331 RepID=A0AAW0JMJ3_QUESU
MPATAGRVRMPANNRVHSSAALQTHGIWQSAIGYDPYAPNKEDGKNSAKPNASANSEPDAENAYASFQGLLALARITGSNANEARGACKKCGRVGHLTFQCRNFLSAKDDKDKDPEAIEAAALAELDKLKGNVGKLNGKSRKNAVGSSEESDEEDDSEDSDSDADSEIERIIAERSGKKLGTKGRSLRKKKDSDKDEHRDSRERKKRGRSKKRSGKRGSSESDDSDGGKKKRKERRRKRDESSDDDYERERWHRKSRKEKRRRRSHRHSDNTDSDASDDSCRERTRKSRRPSSPSDSDASGSDDSWVGRGKKRSETKSRKRRHDEDY